MLGRINIAKLLLVLAVSVCAHGGNLEAQIDPGNAGKTGSDLAGIKTDPVLSDPTGMFSIKTDPVLSDPKEMVGIKTDPVLSEIDALLGLLAAFEKSGAKVSYKIFDFKGVTMLGVFLDGTAVSVLALDCSECAKIVYEY